MTVEQADVIDGVGMRTDGSGVELLISDHLGWETPHHFDAIATKIDAYVHAIRSGQLDDVYPAAGRMPTFITLVWQHAPSGEAVRFLASISQQLEEIGIGFTHKALPDGH